MGRYLLRRLLLVIPTVFGAVSLVFFAMQIAPGDPVTLFLPPQMPGGADPELVAAIRKEHGFDRPLYEQYGTYLGRMARLDFGRSLRQDTDVAEDLKRRIANTFQLGFASLVVAGVLGITLGTVSAIWRGSGIDNASMVMALLGVSLPSFWIAMMLIVAFGLFLPILPPSGYGGPVYTQEGVRYAILPIVTLGLAGAGSLARYTRSALLEVLGQDYVRTARAKGLRESVVVSRHALRNALLPVLTVLGLSFGEILSGTVVVETVFSWPGVGRYLISGVNGRDFPVVQACVLVIALGFVCAVLITDMLLAYADPRIRFR
jgi:ABC-type dipeptide/oligopeptide/nickel transport system permease component